MSLNKQAPMPICANRQIPEFAKFSFNVLYRDETRAAFLVRFNLETAVGRARGCRFQVLRKGATTRMAAPCKEEQRSRSA